jgi:hypothetical protein
MLSSLATWLKTPPLAFWPATSYNKKEVQNIEEKPCRSLEKLFA